MDQHGLHLPAKYLHRYVRQLDIEHRGDTRETRMAIHETTRYRQYVDEFNTAMAIFTYWHISKSWKACLVTDQRLIPFHSPTLQLKFEFGSHFTAYMLEVTTGSRFCFENGLDTVIQSTGKHQVILDLQVTRENPSWRSICLVCFNFATFDAMPCIVCQSSCALPGSKKFELKLPVGARTRGHNFRTFLSVYLTSFVPSRRPPTVHRDQRRKIRGVEKNKMGKCKRIKKFLGRFLCCSKSAMKNHIDSD